jgi:hypothetical protein
LQDTLQGVEHLVVAESDDPVAEGGELFHAVHVGRCEVGLIMHFAIQFDGK